MAIDVKLIRVLLSSPQDMRGERDATRSAVDELNRTSLATTGVRLEWVGWETHGAPDFATYPQEVLNRQLKDWDIYVGLLGHRFGTPTPEASSGTEEEFRQAYARWKTDNRSCRLMFYFSEGLVSPAQIDPNQLAKVQAFRKELGTIGGLYWTFRDSSEFAQLFRGHLLRSVADYGVTWGPKAVPSIETSQTPEPLVTSNSEEDAAGLLDITADGEVALERFSTSLGLIGTGMTKMTQELLRKTAEIHALAATGQASAYRTRAIAGAAATEIEVFGDLINSQVPSFRQHWNAFRQSFFQILALSVNLSPADKRALTTLQATMATMRDTAISSAGKMDELITAMEAGSPLSKDMRRAVRKTGAAIAAYNSEVRFVASDADTLQKAIKEKLGPEGE